MTPESRGAPPQELLQNAATTVQRLQKKWLYEATHKCHDLPSTLFSAAR